MTKSLVVLLALMVILTGLLLSGDSLATTADTTVPNNEITSNTNQTDSPLSANATITIIMTTPPLPREQVSQTDLERIRIVNHGFVGARLWN